MKTKRVKGFTLIELIVVIAIIGVLAAILVPAMLGYVRKSKLSSANTAAASIFKAINTALTELDEDSSIDVTPKQTLKYNGTIWSSDGTSVNSQCGATGPFDLKVATFFDKMDRIKIAEAYCVGGVCVGVAQQTDAVYTGTDPGGVVTTDNYKTMSGTTNFSKATAALQTKIDWTALT